MRLEQKQPRIFTDAADYSEFHLHEELYPQPLTRLECEIAKLLIHLITAVNTDCPRLSVASVKIRGELTVPTLFALIYLLAPFSMQ
jgi:hypothetical protein